MNDDLFDLVGHDLKVLADVLTEALHSTDSLDVAIELGKERGLHRGVEILRAIPKDDRVRVQQTVMLCLVSDSLSRVAQAVVADGHVSVDEMTLAYTAVGPLVNHLGAQLERYSRFAQLEPEQLTDFFYAFLSDPAPYGGGETSPTDGLAGVLCAAAHVTSKHSGPLEKYENIALTLLSSILHVDGLDGLGGLDGEERENARKFHDHLVELRRWAHLRRRVWKQTRREQASGSHHGRPADPADSTLWKADPKKAAELHAEGLYLLRTGDPGRAVTRFEEAIRADWPNSLELGYFDARAQAYAMKGNGLPQRAIDHLTEASEHHRNGRTRAAISSYHKAIEADPGCVWAQNNLGWLLATCADDELRNGTEAMKYAYTACQISDGHCWCHLYTLAVACAESGEFERAVTIAEAAVSLAPEASRGAVLAHLELFRAGLPVRQT